MCGRGSPLHLLRSGAPLEACRKSTPPRSCLWDEEGLLCTSKARRVLGGAPLLMLRSRSLSICSFVFGGPWRSKARPPSKKPQSLRTDSPSRHISIDQRPVVGLGAAKKDSTPANRPSIPGPFCSSCSRWPLVYGFSVPPARERGAHAGN